MPIQTILPRALAELRHSRSVLIIDVRTAGEYAAVHLEPSRLLPLDEVHPGALDADAQDSPRSVYLICGTDVRSRMAAERLVGDARFQPVVVEGGITAWLAAGLPVVRGRGVIALERQVRIGSGSLVLLGVVLGWQVHPLCYLLSGFVGTGLVIAGITNTCGMGLLLTRMPWNRPLRATTSAQTCS